jgi:hypothetical protein
MQHLRKFNENKSELDIHYFEECFIEFLDNTKENENNYTTSEIDEYGITWEHKGDDYWHIQIFFPPNKVEDSLKPRRIDSNFMEKVAEHNDAIGEVYKDIDVAIKKVEIKYPDADFLFQFTNGDDYYNYKSPASIGVFIYKEKK